MAWQYCKCGVELNPEDEDFLVSTITCSCGIENAIVYSEDTRIEILKQMYRDIQELKERANGSN